MIIVAKKHFSFDDEPGKSRPRQPSRPTQAKPRTQTTKRPATSSQKHFDFSDSNQGTQNRKKAQPHIKRQVKQPKKTKTKGLKKWQIVLLVILVVVVALTGTMIYMAREDGPVYGDRCEGLVSVKNSVLKKSEEEIKSKNKLINTIDITIQCKEFKFDIDFNHSATENQAKKICYNAIKILDKNAGLDSYKGSKYSVLLNEYKNVKQFECDFYLTCSSGDAWPIYGTKMAGNDNISFSDAKIKNRSSYNKAKNND